MAGIAGRISKPNPPQAEVQVDGFRFTIPIAVRYGDVDGQRHVNNAAYFTFMEQVRTEYFIHLGLWDGLDYESIGMILAEINCRFERAILLRDPIIGGFRIERLGRKSLIAQHRIEHAQTGELMAAGQAALVAFDYARSATIEIPPHWRRRIAEFETLDRSAAGADR